MTSKEQKNQINLHLPNDYKGEPVEIIIREGEAPKELDAKEPIKVEIFGTITSPFEWLSKRVGLINQNESHLLVCRDRMSISLTIDEKNHYRTYILGSLETSKEMNEFGINTNEKWEPAELSLFMKMNRAFFTNKNENMTLVSTLKNFKAKIHQKVEELKAENGSKIDCFSQTVDSNLPKSFKLNIPLFKGFPKEEIEVEIYADIDGREISLTLISAGANEIIEEYKNKVIDEQLKKIREIAPDLAIIET